MSRGGVKEKKKKNTAQANTKHNYALPLRPNKESCSASKWSSGLSPVVRKTTNSHRWKRNSLSMVKSLAEI